MRGVTKFGLILLGIWLIANALQTFVKFSFTGMDYVMAGVAIVAGVCLIIGKTK